MEILPVEEIRDDLEAMALLRMELFELQHTADQQLIELNLELLRSMGETGLEYELSERTGKAMSMLSTAQEKIRKDGMIGQLELKAGVVETLEKEQYHEKENLPANNTAADDEALSKMKEKQKEQSVLFISNQMGAKMRQISLAEEDFYYYVKDLLKLWREREQLIGVEEPEPGRQAAGPDALDAESLDGPDAFEKNVEQISTLTESYLAGYLKVMNTIKDVVLRKQLLIVIHSSRM